jgi:hypothetical protein
MKKIVLSCAMAILASAAMSQNVQSNKPVFEHTPSSMEIIKEKGAQNKFVLSEWYFPTNWLTSFTQNTGIETFVDFLISDSLPRYINPNDSTFRLQDIAAGLVIDPKDNIILTTNTPQQLLSRFTGYTVDSIFFQYIYVRHVDSLEDDLGNKTPVVDTLEIQYFEQSRLTRGSFGGGAPGIFARPGWDLNTRTTTNRWAVDTRLLTIDDTTSALNNNGFENRWTLGSMTLKTPSDLFIPPGQNNYFGFVIQFRPGMPYDSNSVFVYQRDPATFTGERVNYFGYRFMQNSGTTQWRTNDFVNHGLFSPVSIAYYPGTHPGNNSWSGFIPGNAFNSGRMMIAGMHITTTANASLNDFKNEFMASTQVYPNPARSSEQAIIGFNLKERSTVSATITNLMGQKVRDVFSSTFNEGVNAEYVNINGLKPGIYFITLEVNGTSISKKLTITE